MTALFPAHLFADIFQTWCREPKSVRAANVMHTSRPEALPLDFLVRPQSKVDPDEVRARAKSVHHDQHRIKVSFLLQPCSYAL